MVDLVGENIDVAVRIGPVGGEGLVARPLQPYRMGRSTRTSGWASW